MWQSGLPRPRHQRTYWLLSLIPLDCHTFNAHFHCFQFYLYIFILSLLYIFSLLSCIFSVFLSCICLRFYLYKIYWLLSLILLDWHTFNAHFLFSCIFFCFFFCPVYFGCFFLFIFSFSFLYILTFSFLYILNLSFSVYSIFSCIFSVDFQFFFHVNF